MSSYATIYALSKMFDLELVLLKSQFDFFQPFFPNISEDLVVEKRFCKHCTLKWLLRMPQWFQMVKEKKVAIRKGAAITLPAYPNEPEFYKVSLTFSVLL
jgi:hypothetical protein